jgi:hypothetical protein
MVDWCSHGRGGYGDPVRVLAAARECGRSQSCTSCRSRHAKPGAFAVSTGDTLVGELPEGALAGLRGSARAVTWTALGSSRAAYEAALARAGRAATLGQISTLTANRGLMTTMCPRYPDWLDCTGASTAAGIFAGPFSARVGISEPSIDRGDRLHEVRDL